MSAAVTAHSLLLRLLRLPGVSAADIEHVLPLLLLPTLDRDGAGDDVALPAPVALVLGELALLCGIAPSAGPDEVAARVRTFYERYPPHAAVIEAIRAWLRASVDGDGAVDAGHVKAMAAALGGPVRSTTVPAGPRVNAGPLARAAAALLLDNSPKEPKT